MIPLGILTKHKPGGLPRTGPTRSPTESGSSFLPIRQPVLVLCAIPPMIVDLALHLSIFTGPGCKIFFLAAIWRVLQLASSISGSGTLKSLVDWGAPALQLHSLATAALWRPVVELQ